MSTSSTFDSLAGWLQTIAQPPMWLAIVANAVVLGRFEPAQPATTSARQLVLDQSWGERYFGQIFPPEPVRQELRTNIAGLTPGVEDLYSQATQALSSCSHPVCAEALQPSQSSFIIALVTFAMLATQLYKFRSEQDQYQFYIVNICMMEGMIFGILLTDFSFEALALKFAVPGIVIGLFLSRILHVLLRLLPGQASAPATVPDEKPSVEEETESTTDS